MIFSFATNLKFATVFVSLSISLALSLFLSLVLSLSLSLSFLLFVFIYLYIYIYLQQRFIRRLIGLRISRPQRPISTRSGGAV